MITAIADVMLGSKLLADAAIMESDYSSDSPSWTIRGSASMASWPLVRYGWRNGRARKIQWRARGGIFSGQCVFVSAEFGGREFDFRFQTQGQLMFRGRAVRPPRRRMPEQPDQKTNLTMK